MNPPFKTHHGVGLVITNSSKNLFFVQCKDNTYPIEKWRGAYSFWGGAIEPKDKTSLIALEREITEEIPQAKPILDLVPRQEVGSYWIDSDNRFHFTLFEVRLPDTHLYGLQNVTVLEGESRLVSRDNLFKNQWVWDLGHIMENYLNLK